MRSISHRSVTFAIGVTLLLAAAGCSTDSTSDSDGAAGAPSGGTAGSGDATGSGGTTGGSTATGGSGGASGSPATGGNPATGGAPATGGGPPTGGATGTSPFRGVSIAEWSGVQAQHCADVNTLGVSWYYNWSTGTGCTTPAEYVPQVWGDWNLLGWVDSPAELAARGETVALGFNEPDHTDQSNLTVARVLELWPEFDQPGLRVGSPATAADGQAWFEAFMAGVAAQSLRVDFIALHWYGWNAGSCNDVGALEAYIEWAEQWNRPIWITEWNCRLQGADVTQTFYDAAIAMFANHSLVERHAWFLPRSSGDFAGGALLDATGTPTAFGTDFIASPAFR